ASSPSMPGICTSSSSTSGARSSVSASASAPLTASPTTSASGISPSRLRSRSRAGGSSSTISTLRRTAPTASSCARRRGRGRGRGRGLPLDQWKAHRHDVLTVEAAGLHQRALAVHELEPLADVGERQAVAGTLLWAGAERVAHHYGDQAGVQLAGD